MQSKPFERQAHKLARVGKIAHPRSIKCLIANHLQKQAIKKTLLVNCHCKHCHHDRHHTHKLDEDVE